MTKYVLLIVLILFYIDGQNIRLSTTRGFDYADLYNSSAAASYSVSKGLSDGISDLDSCETSTYDGAMKVGYEEGCKAQIMGKKPPRIIIINPYSYIHEFLDLQ
jgi:hypothetical protein